MTGIGVDSLSGTIPKTVFSMFQLTFAIITPALIVGAFAERMKFSAMLWFMAIWLTVVYAPIAHWVWGDGGWLGELGVKDFAGGTVVQINAGVPALATALVLGKRKGYPTTPMPPHNLILTVVGASMLWVGWFGFNAGSALAADGTAGMAMTVTQITTATAALGGTGLDKGVSIGAQVWKQAIGIGVTIVYDLALNLVILKLLDAFIGLRVSEEQETAGLDIALHDERGYNL